MNEVCDFEFEGLAANRSYTIHVEHKGYKKWELSVKPSKDLNLGEIILEPTG